MPPDPSTAPDPAVQRSVHAAGTTFSVHVRGEGPPVLVIHGAGEDSTMLAPLAERLVARGRRVITYDRRGTGASGRECWPGGGADQHADDAAAILRALGIAEAEVVGLSSGGVIALVLAGRHRTSVAGTFVWEAPALGVIPGAEAMNAAIMAPVDAHLASNPGDFAGAQAILLTAILGFPVRVDDPLFAPARANAEPMIRDDPSIVSRPLSAEELDGLAVTIAVGSDPNEVVATAARALARLTGRPPLEVDLKDHEAYLTDPETFADIVVGAPMTGRSSRSTR